MSDRDQEIVSRLRRSYEAYSRADFDAAIEIAHPDIEFVPPGGQSALRGAQEFRSWMEPDALEDARIEAREVRVNGHRVLIHHHASVRGARSGIELEIDSWVVGTMDKDGRLTRLEAFLPHQKPEAL